MSKLTEEMERLRARIEAADADLRYMFQPELEDLIERMEIAGEPVPAAIRDLNEELLGEAIERQLDNLPV